MPKTTALRLPGFVPLLAVCLLLGPGLDGVTAAPAGPQVIVRTLDAKPVSGGLASIDTATLRIETGEGDPSVRTVELGRALELRFAPPTAAPEKKDRMRVRLVAGDTFLGVFAGPSEEGIRLDVPALGRVDLSFDVILSIEDVPADADACHHPARVRRPDPSLDIAYDKKGDEVRGTVLEATDSHLVLETKRGRKRSVRWTDLHVAHLKNEASPAPKERQTELDLWSGTRIAVGKPFVYASGIFRVSSRSIPGKVWQVQADAVKALWWRGGEFVYATALPFRSRYRGYYADAPSIAIGKERALLFGASVGYRRLRNERSCPLRLGGRTYRFGFGVNSHSTIELDLNGGYKTFRAGIGIDDSVLSLQTTGENRGNVDARVLGDGKVLWSGKGIRGGQPMRRIGPLDVSSVKTLVLEVGFGSDGFLYGMDRADWVDPILERK